MYKPITGGQKALMAELFKRTGKTFQELAQEAKIRYIPDHLEDLSYKEALSMLNYHRKILGDKIDGNV